MRFTQSPDEIDIHRIRRRGVRDYRVDHGIDSVVFRVVGMHSEDDRSGGAGYGDGIG